MNGITHGLSVQIGRSEVGIKLAADGMPLRTAWQYILIKTRSVSNEQQMQGHYARAGNSNESKRSQYQISSRSNDIAHGLRV